MLGRLTLEVLNEFVSAFNLTIFEKYKFINNSHHSSEGDYKRIQDYKLQENSDTKGKLQARFVSTCSMLLFFY